MFLDTSKAVIALQASGWIDSNIPSISRTGRNGAVTCQDGTSRGVSTILNTSL